MISKKGAAMTDQFEIQIIPFSHYVKLKEADYTQFIIQFNVVQDGIPYDNGRNNRFECCDRAIKDMTIFSRMTKDSESLFAAPTTLVTYICFAIGMILNITLIPLIVPIIRSFMDQLFISFLRRPVMKFGQ